MFFVNDTATAEIYTLSLHDARPIYEPRRGLQGPGRGLARPRASPTPGGGACSRRACAAAHRPRHRAASMIGPMSATLPLDRKSTRLNSSHAHISYAVFCLKKKKFNT